MRPKAVAINGTRLDKMLMPMEPYGNGVLAYLSYPKSQIRLSDNGGGLTLVVPAYIAVELYRIGILPQDVNTSVKISIGGRSAGSYQVSDVRYPHRSDSPFGQVTFTLSRVLQDARHAAGGSPRSHSPAGGNGEYVMDITHYLDEAGEMAQMPGPARKLASFLTLLIEAATSASLAQDHDTRIRCRARACRGTIRTSLVPGQEEIAWHCPACGHHGVIRNWQNTKWNQLNRSEQPE